MAKEKLPSSQTNKYRVVDSALLNRGRHGKHYDLMQGILKELKAAEGTSALEIPLDDVGEIGLANLRSAVHRMATAEGLEIQTLADEKKLLRLEVAPIEFSSTQVIDIGASNLMLNRPKILGSESKA